MILEETINIAGKEVYVETWFIKWVEYNLEESTVTAKIRLVSGEDDCWISPTLSCSGDWVKADIIREFKKHITEL